MADTYFSDQLNGLLTLELKYSTRDYLLDTIVAVHQDNDHINTNENVNGTDQNQNQNQSWYKAAAVVTAVENAAKKVMITSSTSTAPCHRNKEHKHLSIEQQVVNWRKKICVWSYRVVDHFELRRDIVYVAINYLDRYYASFHKNNTEVGVDVDNLDVVGLPLLQNKNKFQLVAMASLCLAMKVYGEIEIDMKEETTTETTESLIIETIVQLGRGQFTVAQLKLMEIDVLQRLQWLLHPPTPQLFVSYYLNELFCPWNNKDDNDDDDDNGNDDAVDTTRTMTTMMSRMTIELKELTLFIIELSVHDYYFVMNSNKSSVIALAALLNAAQLLIDSSSSVSASSSLSSPMMMLIRTTTRAILTKEEKNDDYNVEVDDVLSSPSSVSPLSSTWLMDLQQDLFRSHHYNCRSNNSDDYSADTTTTTRRAGSATTCTRTTTSMLNAYRERLLKLYMNTDTKIEDFLSNNSISTSNPANDNDDAMFGNGDDNDGIYTTREPSPTSVDQLIK